MLNRVTDEQLGEIVQWAETIAPLHGKGHVVMAGLVADVVAELRERRAIDRNLVNSQPRNARWRGQRRRK